MIDFTIDALTPCLKNTETGELVETEVIRIKRKSFLSKYNRKTGWIVDWSDFLKLSEVYALVLKGTVDIQGLIAIQNDDCSNSVYIVWAVASPENNKWHFGKQDYEGVGGHLFAIAIAKSLEFGYDGMIYADAVDETVLNHYVENYSAIKLGTHAFPYRFAIDGVSAKKILEVYGFDWQDFDM